MTHFEAKARERFPGEMTRAAALQKIIQILLPLLEGG